MKLLRNQREDLTREGAHRLILCLKTFIRACSALKLRHNVSHLPLKRSINKLPKPQTTSPKCRVIRIFCFLSLFMGQWIWQHKSMYFNTTSSVFLKRFVLFLYKPFQYHPAGEKYACKYLAPFLSLDSQEKSRGQFLSALTTPQGWDIHFHSHASWQASYKLYSILPTLVYPPWQSSLDLVWLGAQRACMTFFKLF